MVVLGREENNGRCLSSSITNYSRAIGPGENVEFRRRRFRGKTNVDLRTKRKRVNFTILNGTINTYVAFAGRIIVSGEKR